MKSGAKPKGQVLLEWSPKFAYAVGLLTADGCLINDGRHIDLTSKDYEQVQNFKECLGLKVRIGTKKSGAGNKAYRIQFGDVLFYKFLLDIGLSPAKSKTISAVKVPEMYFSDFLRGYFDGDGTTSSFYDTVFPESFRFYLAFVSASPEFIRWLRQRVKQAVGVEGHIVTYSKRNYENLKYAKHDAIKVCEYMYSKKGTYFLRRKYLKIQDSMRIINRRRGGETGKHATFRS